MFLRWMLFQVKTLESHDLVLSLRGSQTQHQVSWEAAAAGLRTGTSRTVIKMAAVRALPKTSAQTDRNGSVTSKCKRKC